jgi:hypothetical protein
MIKLPNNHPIQELRFLVPRGISEEEKTFLERYVSVLANSREWVLGGPEINEEVEHPEGLGHDGPTFIEVKIKVYSAIPPWNAKLPKNIDEAHFNEANQLVRLGTKVSDEFIVDLDFFLDETFVGQIKKGRPDKLLTEGLLGEWEKFLKN